MIPCPRCATAVQPDWDWCHRCGYDPEGLRPTDGSAGPAAAPAPPAARPGSPIAPLGTVPPRPPVAGLAPVYAPPPYAGLHGGATSGTAPRSSGAATAIKAVLIVGTAGLALVVVLVAAVAFLGKNPTTPSGTAAPAATPSGGAGASGGAIDPWATWTASDGSFSVDFPITPTVIPAQAIDPALGHTEQVMADMGSAAYGAVYLEAAPGVPFDAEKGLNGMIDGAASGGGITITSRQDGMFGFSPSQSFTGTINGTGQATGIAFRTANRVYLLFVVGDASTPVQFDRFLASFTLR